MPARSWTSTPTGVSTSSHGQNRGNGLAPDERIGRLVLLSRHQGPGDVSGHVDQGHGGDLGLFAFEQIGHPALASSLAGHSQDTLRSPEVILPVDFKRLNTA